MADASLDVSALRRLLELGDGDVAFVEDVVGAYLDDAPLQLTAMRDAADADDATALVRSAHTLKSTSASLGAQRLVDICRAVEAEAREGALERAAARIQEAEAEYGRVAAGLARRPWDSL